MVMLTSGLRFVIDLGPGFLAISPYNISKSNFPEKIAKNLVRIPK